MPERPTPPTSLEEALRLAAKARRDAADIAADDQGASAAAEAAAEEEDASDAPDGSPRPPGEG